VRFGPIAELPCGAELKRAPGAGRKPQFGELVRHTLFSLGLLFFSPLVSAQEKPMAITLDDLTVNFSYLKREDLLSDWKWLIGAKLPILLTASGDAFVQDAQDGSVHVLDVGAGELHKVAKSTEEFQSLLSNKKFVADYLAVDMIVDLKKSGRTLKKGQIYSFKKPPVLGGEYKLENLEPTDIEVHFSLSGQIHEKVSKLKPGTPIKGVAIK
jgi:hypothetical protein